MPAYDLTGTVKLIMDQQTFPSGFTKREFVVTADDDRYPQDIKFECVKDRCAMLDAIEPGQKVTVSFDIRGNEHNDRFYVNLSAWKVQSGDTATSTSPAQDDDIPFDVEQPPTDEDTGMPF